MINPRLSIDHPPLSAKANSIRVALLSLAHQALLYYSSTIY